MRFSGLCLLVVLISPYHVNSAEDNPWHAARKLRPMKRKKQKNTKNRPITAPTIMSTSNITNSTNSSRFLFWDGDYLIVEEEEANMTEAASVQVNPSAFAYESERNICQKVDGRLVNNEANRKMCGTYLNLPLIKQLFDNGVQSCDVAETLIPKTLYTVSKTSEVSLTAMAVKAQNPGWKHEHFGDEEAYQFIVDNCGEEVANAYQCLAPPAYRADLFRFCALYSKGGMYMDFDIMPVVKLEELYDPCAVASIGHDWPQGRPQKQMKILAGQQGAPIFLCMINKILTNVRARFYPDNPLALTGPMVLHKCYEENSRGVSVVYRDTRDAVYPYSGMRGGENGEVLAVELPPRDHDGGHNYKVDFDLHEVYRPTCPLHSDAMEEPPTVSLGTI